MLLRLGLSRPCVEYQLQPISVWKASKIFMAVHRSLLKLPSNHFFKPAHTSTLQARKLMHAANGPLSHNFPFNANLILKHEILIPWGVQLCAMCRRASAGFPPPACFAVLWWTIEICIAFIFRIIHIIVRHFSLSAAFTLLNAWLSERNLTPSFKPYFLYTLCCFFLFAQCKLMTSDNFWGLLSF